MLSIPNTPCPVSLQLLFLLRIITCPSLLSQTAHSGLALEGFPEKRTFKYRPEGSKGGTRQRAGKHRVPKYKGPEEGAGMCLKKHREASVAEAE